jgi:hypothetical protein
MFSVLLDYRSIKYSLLFDLDWVDSTPTLIFNLLLTGYVHVCTNYTNYNLNVLKIFYAWASPPISMRKTHPAHKGFRWFQI